MQGNQWVQPVLTKHGDVFQPNLCFFAQRNIPPWTELTYDYGWQYVTENLEVRYFQQVALCLLKWKHVCTTCYIDDDDRRACTCSVALLAAALLCCNLLLQNAKYLHALHCSKRDIAHAGQLPLRRGWLPRQCRRGCRCRAAAGRSWCCCSAAGCTGRPVKVWAGGVLGTSGEGL